MAGGQNSAQKIKIAERQAMALSLRKQGGSYRQIAAQLRQVEGISLKYSERQAYLDVSAALSRIREKTSEEAKEYIQLELNRLDEIVSVLWPKVLKGDLIAIQTLLKVIDLRAKLLGLPSTGIQGISVAPGGQLNIDQKIVFYIPDNGRGDLDSEVKLIPEAELVLKGT